jgi:hypothetical protein
VTQYSGGCHCGALKLIYRTNIDPASWQLRTDGCSFCRRHGVVATSDPAGEVEFEVGDPARVRRYRFGQKTAEFLVCGECGVFVAAICDTSGGACAVINVRVLEGLALNLGSVTTVDFNNESPEKRMERRARNWTPVRG